MDELFKVGLVVGLTDDPSDADTDDAAAEDDVVLGVFVGDPVGELAFA